MLEHNGIKARGSESLLSLLWELIEESESISPFDKVSWQHLCVLIRQLNIVEQCGKLHQPHKPPEKHQ